ncbi:MAG: hypothetical protein K0S11_1354, partial [Gammaproteobacteria bacterium]|nr:hypothetical protein [Gammaproteobacteria bacterium]
MKKIVQNIPVLPIQCNFLLLSLQTGPYYHKFGKGFNKRAVGFSMTELMIAVTLATLLLLILTTIYRVAKQNYLLEQAEAT